MVRRLLVALAVVALPTVIVSSPGPVRADSNEGQPGLRQGAASAITAGNHHTCAVLSGGFVKCWGYNGDGELGQGSTDNLGDNPLEMGAHLPTVDLGTGRTATAVSAGSNFTCALLDNGTVKCWGYNAEGELGQGSIADLGDQINEMGDHLPAIDLGTGRKATSISAGASHACALLDDGSVKCWGNNIFGQLGQGSIAILGDQSNEMGDHLPPVDLGTGRTATAISAGTNHTCALLDNGTVKCWGVNTDGELGQGSTAWVGDQPNEMGDHLPPVDLGTGRTAIAITAGGNHTCASLDNATLKCWGQNSRGELGQGSTASLGDQPNEMGDHLVPVALGTGRAATAVSAGGTFTCALLDNGTDKCWGNDNEGQSGQNSTTRYGDQPNEMGDFLPAINLGVGRTATAITTGFTESCALLDDASIKCWGFGTYGELGQENMQQLGDQPGEMAALASISLGGGTSGLVVPAPVAPAAPVGVSGTAGVQSVALSWTAPTDNGGAAVTGYRVETSTDDGLHWTRTISDTATTATTKTIDNLTAGQAIRFRVSALNSKGASPASLPSTALTPAAPALPPGLQYTALNPARILDTRVDGATVDNQFHTGVKLAAAQEIALQVAGRGGVPANATAVVLNVTVTDPEASGYLTVFPCGTTAPNASNLNYTTGETIPNAVVVKLSATGTVCFHTQQTTNVLADVNGAFTTGYTPLDPARILDTRADGATVDNQFHTGVKLAAGQEIALQVAGRGGVPANATAVVLNVTVTDPEASGYLTVFPCGTTAPNASNLNYTTGETIPNAVVVKLSAAGTVCFHTQQTTNVLADVNGAFTTGYTPLDPARILDTRADGATVDNQFHTGVKLAAGQEIVLQVAGRGGVPANSTAVVLNVTVTDPEAAGYLTVYPCGTTAPNASNLNYTAGETIPNAVVVKLSAAGTVCFHTQQTTNLLADVNGAIT